jgi:hypothetical protein
MGKGLTEMRSLQREHCPNVLDRNYNANLTAGDSQEHFPDCGSEYL